ncbi:helix-turn-helix domain-containing protein [Microlunatus soli]|uniref:AraC family transcriptional regulator, arabinose operon regulatory protein n=1 Tax=Microlunatus soli TaxID=630515 RepID=A0A1H1ZHU4_9ACTN|nr:helix-turn-helix domain-containing protein [Microlunatus soli]SDT33127.1 AraC family transcriptional regulator, arabinose operon regulatory protein [Microlunatus soli]
MRSEAIIPVYVRISAGHFDEDADYATFRSRGTDDWLLIHTLAGAGRFGDGEQVHRAEPGQVTLITPGTPHDYRTDPDAGRWQFYFAHFRARSDWRSLLDWPALSPGLHQLTVDGNIREQVETNLADAVRWSHSLLRQSGLLGLNRLEAALLWCDLANPLTQPLDPRVRDVVRTVEEDLRRQWTLADLARIVDLSESRISHLFRSQLGLSPLGFVEQRRMLLAAQLLDLTSRPVGAVAAEVGYADPLYFSARFKRQYGLSPRAYRRRPIPADEPS